MSSPAARPIGLAEVTEPLPPTRSHTLGSVAIGVVLVALPVVLLIAALVLLPAIFGSDAGAAGGGG